MISIKQLSPEKRLTTASITDDQYWDKVDPPMTIDWFETSVILNSLKYTTGQLEVRDADPDTIATLGILSGTPDLSVPFVDMVNAVVAERSRLTFV